MGGLFLVGGLIAFLVTRPAQSHVGHVEASTFGHPAGHDMELPTQPALDTTLSASPAVQNINVSNFTFNPATVTIPRGTTVHWNFVNGVHTTTSGDCCVPDGLWDSDFVTAPGSFDRDFNEAGTFPYFCQVHGVMMTGTINVTALTAAGVTVSGRVLDAQGRGIRQATVSISDEKGNRRQATVDKLGYYSFADVEPGHTYLMEVSQRRYSFAPRLEAVNDNLSEINFVAQDLSERNKRSR